MHPGNTSVRVFKEAFVSLIAAPETKETSYCDLVMHS